MTIFADAAVAIDWESHRRNAFLSILTLEVIRSAELEGEALPERQVYSSLAARLGMEIATPAPAGIDASSAAGVILDTFFHHDQPVTEKRLTGWHMSIMPIDRNRMNPLVHYQRPQSQTTPARLRTLLHWFDSDSDIDPVMKAGVAHWWLMTIRPFGQGNGRIARALADLQLARAENGGFRYYSLSDSICSDREAYTRFFSAALPHAAASPDITPFLEWFLDCLTRALTSSHLANTVRKAGFWEAHAAFEFNGRQRLILGRLLDGTETRRYLAKKAAFLRPLSAK